MPDFLELEARKRIYECIEKRPGIHFREVQRITNLATGSLDYHLHFLEKHSMIHVEGDKGFRRYYTLTRNYSEEEKKILSLLRQKRIRHIILYMIEKKETKPGEIAEALQMSDNTLSWYLKKLTEDGIIKFSKKGRFRKYKVVDPKLIVKYIIEHKGSFFDSLVDRFIEAWEE